VKEICSHPMCIFLKRLVDHSQFFEDSFIHSFLAMSATRLAKSRMTRD
jgi:hypothetical protein